jgi:putative spermidine/putrescine transport system permease protein
LIPRGAQRLLGAFTLLVSILAIAPVAVIVLESFTTTDYVVFPPQGFSLKWYGEFLKRPEFVHSVFVSFIVAVANSVVATTLGTMIALALSRYSFLGNRFLQSLFMAPLSLPGIILGLALLQTFARFGLPRNVVSMTLTHIVITMPFAIRFVSVALIGVERDIERAAQSLGANRWLTFRHITFPLIRPGIVASLVFTLILSFDEVAASLFMASPNATTLPVRIFVYIEQNYDPLVTSVSSLLVFAAVIALVIIERTVGMGRLFGVR